MDDRELMQMALDALKDAALCVQHNSCPPDGGNDWDEQIEALRDRLAQPEPEPGGWREVAADQTDRELIQMALNVIRNGPYKYLDVAGRLEKRLRQPEPEPIKRSFSDDVGRLLKAGKGFYDDDTPIDYKDIQLKIEGTGEDTFECVEVRIPRPPQREWIGLTDEERKQVRSSAHYNQFMTAGEYAKAVQKATEAKLKEKNHD
jgi:hypothetical protein